MSGPADRTPEFGPMVHNGALVQKKTLRKLAGKSNEHAAAPPSSFASNFLKKLGWQEGDGLGKDRAGRTSHVRVDMKDDVRGIGCKDESKEDFTGAWWNAGFDNALANLNVGAGGANSDDSSDDSSDDEHELEEDAKISIQLRDMSTYSEADRKLFVACGGRRPGQRAGRLQTGKIIREHLADKSFKAKLASIDPSKAREEFHKIAQSTIVTLKSANGEVETVRVETVAVPAVPADSADSADGQAIKSAHKSKKSKKKRTRTDAMTSDSDRDDGEVNEDGDEKKEEKKKKKKKKKKEKKAKKTSKEATDNASEAERDAVDEEKKSKKKSKKKMKSKQASTDEEVEKKAKKKDKKTEKRFRSELEAQGDSEPKKKKSKKSKAGKEE